MKRIVLTSVLALAVFVLSGCSPVAPASPPTPIPTVTVTATPLPTSSSAAPTATPTTTPPAAPVDPNAPADQCENENLTLSLGQANGGAGSDYVDIIFTNTGTQSCTLRGAPGVSVVGEGDGTQLGAAATQTVPADPPTIQLAPGGSARSTLQSVNIQGDGGPLDDRCTVVTGDGYRVYSPHSFDAVFVPSAGVPACSNGTVWMSVTAVTG